MPDASLDPSVDEETMDLLPDIVSLALRNGLVRVAAGMLESAMSVLPLSDPRISAARARIDESARGDAATLAHMLGGRALAVPSLQRDAAGVPRFVLGMDWPDVARHEVRALLDAELGGDGLASEVRNFLDEVLTPGDLVVDCDPGAGAVVLAAATRAAAGSDSATVCAIAADPVIARMLQANIVANKVVERARVARDWPVDAVRTADRVIVHLGVQSVDMLSAALDRGLADCSSVVAWCVNAEEPAGERLSLRGFTHFALAHGESGPEFIPLEVANGNAYAFALSAEFVASLEN